MALVADEIGDRLRRHRLRQHRSAGGCRPGAGAARPWSSALFDLEPTAVDSDYELAFRSVGGGKRALVIVFTDLLEEAAARPLVEAVPVLARRHDVVVASVRDPDLDRAVRTPPTERARRAGGVGGASRRSTPGPGWRPQLGRAGAEVLEAPPDALAAACVGAYLRAKARSRL